MQNFTLGKRGIPMLLFALILLTTSFPSFGQDCPTVSASDQSFCDAQEPTIGDLVATGDNVAWYAEETGGEALPETQLLVNGTTYYAGIATPPCDGTRAAVRVTIFSEPEIIGINATPPTTRQSLAVLGICVADINNPNVYVRDLRTNYDNVAGVQVNWYLSRTSTTPLSSDTELQNNTDYYAGLTVLDPDSGEEICQTNRRRTSVRFYTEAAPTGEGEQTFCSNEDPTLADIVASGTNRYYTSATSNTELSSSTPLVNGRTYYISSLGEFCESTDRLAVTVTVQDPEDLGTPEVGIVCEADVQETFPSVDAIRNYYLALLPEGVPTNGTFDPTPTQLAQQYQSDEDGLGDFTTVYSVAVGNCESSVTLTTTIVALQDANAGTIENQTVECDENDVIVLADLPNEGGMSGGTFTGEGVDENGNFNPAVGPGVYTITYTVDDSSFCITEGSQDFTTFTITVEGIQELPEAIAVELCITEAQAMLANPLQAETFFYNLLSDNGISNLEGDFDESAQVIGAEIWTYINSNPTASKSFDSIIYTLTSDCGSESVAINLTINSTEAPNAGEITPAPVCASTTAFDLYSLLGEGNDAGGTFSNANGAIEDGLFNVSQIGTYTITYTVTESAENCTAGEPDSTQFDLTVNEGIVAESPAPTFVCDADVQTLFPSIDEIRKYYIAIAQRAGFPTNGTLSPNASQLAQQYQNDEDGLGDFTTTYTFGSGECSTSVDLTVTIVAGADAGENGSVTLTPEADAVELMDYLGGTPMSGGTWSTGNGTFDPSTDEEGTYTYTVTIGSCVDTATVTVSIEDETDPTCNAGTPGLGVVCLADVQATFPSVDEIRKYYLNLLDAGVAQNGTLNPTAAELAQIYQNDEDGLGDFISTYTVTNGDCTDSVQLTVRIVESVDAGTNGSVTLNEDDAPVNLFDYLGGTPDMGGTWSNGDGTFDPATDAAGVYTYTVGTESCQATATVTVTITTDPTDPTCTVDAGTPTTGIVCVDDVQSTFPSVDEIRKYYLNLLDAGVARNGTFNPTAAQIAQQYQADADGLGDFTTTYTLVDGDCSDSVELTVRVVEPEEANAGENVNLSFCDTEGEQNLFNFLTEGANAGGSFEGYEDGIFNPSAEGQGTYQITYTVDESASCVIGSATVTFSIEVISGSANAGADNSVERCNADVRNLSAGGVRSLFLSLLDEGVSRNGTFNPTINELISQYNNVSNFGDFTTTYTVGSGDCEDSAVLTVTVIPANDAGDDRNLTFCTTQTSVNLFDYLSSFATTNGTFIGYEDGIFNPSTADAETVITYEVEDDESVCSTGNFTSTFTINVNEPQDANAGGDVAVNYCIDESEDIELTSILGEGALLTGSFSAPYQNGIFNPSVAGEGEYTITYTVDESSCAIGTDTATITITVGGTVSETPVADAEQFFCLSENATVADLVATGDNVVWYSDAELTTEADPTTPLANNAVYYAVATSDDACAPSEAVMVTVTLEDSVAPTIPNLGNEFCRQDSPTVQDLIGNLNGSDIRIYTTLTGGTALANTTALENGVTYYASSTDASVGCESTERLPVNVIVGFCGIPEGFSPNGDNINDRFVIPNIRRDYPNYNIEIYNRWGNLVYRGNQDWDGVSNQSSTLGDKVLPAGVYFYILNYNDGQTSPVQGKVYLSR